MCPCLSSVSDPSTDHLILCLSLSAGQDVDPRDVRFDAAIPDETLRQGWLPVLRYLRELQAQGACKVLEVRLLLIGEGMVGKTSLRHAMTSPSFRTERIATDDRTIGLDVVRDWAVPGGAGVRVRIHDFAGQKEFRPGFSIFISGRYGTPVMNCFDCNSQR